MNKKSAFLLAVLSALSINSFAADLRVGAMTGPEGALADTAAEVAKDKYGLDVEVVKFNDYIAPNVALNDGSLDINVIQHRPYLKNIIKSRGFQIVPVGNTFIYPIGGYSETITSIDELKDGAKIALPNDPSNEGRALLVLQKAGLIKLNDPKKITASVIDIAENPHHFDFVELDGAQLPRILDQVDLAFINNTFAGSAGLLLENAVIAEDKDSPYVNVIAAREDNKDSKEVQEFVKAYQTPAVEAQAEKVFSGGAVKGW